MNDVEESLNLNIQPSSSDNDLYINYDNTDDNTNNNTYLKFDKYCHCDCNCVDICFCRTPLCSQSNDYNKYHANLREYIAIQLSETTILKNNDDIPQPSITIETLNRLILELHVIKGHCHFQKIITEFRDGHYDDDIVQRSKITHHDLAQLKLLSHNKLSHKEFSCIDCTLTKIRGKPHAKVSSRPVGNTPFRKGYVDVIGPFPAGKGGVKYYYLYICDDTSYGLIEAATGKELEDDIKPAITAWRLFARDHGWKMDSLHFDSDPIFIGEPLQNWLKTLDISCHYAPPGQHWKNGLVEAFNKVIQYAGLTMLRASGLPADVWFFAMQHAVELYNDTINKRISRDKYFKLKPNDYVLETKLIRKFPIFGQEVCARDPKANEVGKLEYRGRECAYLGYERRSSSHVLLHLRTGRIIRSADVDVISNLYAYNRKPIVHDQFQRVIGSRLNHVPSLEGPPSATEEELDMLAPANNSNDSEVRPQQLQPVRKVHFDTSTYDGSPFDDDCDEHHIESAPVSNRTRSNKLSELAVPKQTVLLVISAFIDYVDSQLISTSSSTMNTVNNKLTEINQIVMNTALSSKYLGVGVTYLEHLSSQEIREIERRAEDPYHVEKLM